MKSEIHDPCPCGSRKQYKQCCGSANNTTETPRLSVSNLLAQALHAHQNGDLDLAESSYNQILQHDPANDNALNLLGVLNHSRGKHKLAVRQIKKAISLDPDSFEFHYNLGRVFDSAKQYNEAIEHYNKAIEINPDDLNAIINLGRIYYLQNKHAEAISLFQRALTMEPNNGSIHGHLSGCYRRLGLISESVKHAELGIQLDPGIDLPVLYSNFLLTLHYSIEHTTETIYQAHLGFQQRIADTLCAHIPVHNKPVTQKNKLRIGYVSPDFKTHSVSHFIGPVLACHDPSRFEIYAYNNHDEKDKISQQLKKHIFQWRDVMNMGDEDLAKQVQDDEIDILVDLSGHTAMNRLLLFARKPAPIQITWIGYPDTTGLKTMDYRITDHYADPIGKTEQYHTEQLVRMPECFSVYSPPEKTPPVNSLPASDTGIVTFGTFNNLAKINSHVIDVWSMLLTAIDTSRLVIKTSALDDVATTHRIRNEFMKRGIREEQLLLLGSDASQYQHLRRYHMIDIALDTFPYNGTTTTCEALWMGLPVIVMEGKTHVSRVGVSQMNNLELTELIAKNENEYVEIATSLAGNLEQLSKLRAGLRHRLQVSPLMDAETFTRHLEDNYRALWLSWLEKERFKGSEPF